MYERALLSRLREGTRIVLLLGPRQVGKTTLLSSLGPDLTLNLASPAVFRQYVSEPERLELELRAAGPEVRTVFLDEIQRVPPLLDAVQVLIDELPGRFRFLLSGSSARKLRRGEANLLPGRVHLHHLHPLVRSEMGDDFDLERALAHGTLPGIYAQRDPDLRSGDLAAYVDVYLKEEVQAEALVRNLGGYARLLELIAASSGRILNVSALSRESGVSYETTRRYLEVLEDTLLLMRIPAWSGSDRASLIAHPRYYLFDLGVRNALLRRPLDRVQEDERGLLLEHLVALEILRRSGTLWSELRPYHYRTRHGAEVDFVLDVGGDLWCVEVKASRRVPRIGRRGFDSFARRAGEPARRIVVFPGPRRMRIRDVEVLPLEEFLSELPS